MLVISIAFTIASPVFYAIAASVPFSSVSFLSLDRDGGTASAVIAAMCWLQLRRDMREERRDGERAEMRRREEALIRTLDLALTSLADEPANPVRQLHSA